MSATGAVLAAPKARAARACLLPQLLVALLCGGYTVGAALGWGCGEASLVMGDFGLAAGSASACVSALLYARRVAGPARPAWVLFALSSAMSALGNSIWGWYEVVLREPVPQPSVADFCFLMFAPPAIIGLLVLAKRPVTRAGWVCLTLDTWLIGGSLLTLSWSLALARTASDDGPSTARTALSLAYPLLDIVLVSMVLALHFRRSAVNRAAVNTAIAALALTVLCDALFTSPLLRAHYRSGQILDAGWFAGSLLMAYAPWAGPRRPQPRRTGATTRKVAGSLTALTPYLAAAVCTLGILYNVITGQKCDRVVLFTGCTVVMALVVRQGIMLLDNIALTQELAQKENHFRSLVQGSSDVIMIAAPTGVLRYVSPAAQGVYGRDPEEMVGTELAAHIHPGDLGRVVHEVRRFLAAPPGEEPSTRIECRIRSGHARNRAGDRARDRARDGATDGAGPAAPPDDEAGWLHVESSVKRYQGGLIFNSRDITERVRLQAQLQHSASHDPLTDLPNRALFTERVDRALGGRRAGDGRAAVLYVDLDGFKAVNDTIGHQAGDDLLVQAAHRLQAALRAGDTAARLGGDEFAALITGPEGGGTGERQIREIADRLRAVLSEPYPMPGAPGGEMRVGASVGVAFAEPGIGPAELMRRADLAMYRAKQGGKGRVELYAPQPPAEAVRRTERADRLRRALDDGEFTLLHQPVVELSGGRITAVAAQARRRPGHGAPSVPAVPTAPADFTAAQFTPAGLPAADFPAAESADAEFAAAEPGAEVARGEGDRGLDPGRLLERAVAQAALRYAAGHRIPVSVRLPARRLLHRDLPPGAFAALLDRHQLPPGGLLLELAGGDPRITHEELAHRLTALRRLGVRIALGGFGAAYGGPAALCRLPVDEIRLDRLLSEGVAESPRLQKITGGLLRIAADLGVRTVAEGVDRPEQVLALRALGCAQGVGMAFSGPLDEHRLRGALSRGRFPVPREAESAARDSPHPGGPARDLVRRETPREQVASRAVPSPTRRSNAETPVPPA